MAASSVHYYGLIPLEKILLLVMTSDHELTLCYAKSSFLLQCSVISRAVTRYRYFQSWRHHKLLAVATPIWVDFWIFSDQAQLLDPESAASKEPRSGLVA